MIVSSSKLCFAETVSSLTAAIERRGLTLVARIDHAAAARAAGLELEDELVLVFGDPHAGTPLMQSDRRVGIELPLRLLVWREDEQVLVGYNDPRELDGEYRLDDRHTALGQMAALLQELASEAG